MEDSSLIETVLNDLQEANEFEVLKKIVSFFLSNIGIDQFAFICNDSCVSKNQTPLIISNYQTEWLDTYTKNKYYKIDPIIKKTIKDSIPFYWNELLIKNKTTILEEEFLQDAKKHLIKIDEGMTIPTYVRGQKFTSLNLCQYSDNKHAKKIEKKYSYLLLSVATMLHLRAIRLNAPIIDKKLTKREKECLFWASLGKSQEETGQILGVSTRTIRFHNENSMAKLDVKNITSAVSLATAFGYI